MADHSADEPPKRKAEECSWYLLATLHGVPATNDGELRAKNRIAWNRFVTARLSPDKRAALIRNGNYRKEEMTWFTPAELLVIEAAFVKRAGSANPVSFRQLGADIDFSNVEFDEEFIASDFMFATERVDFSGTIFSCEAWFDGATFFGNTLFDRAVFSNDAVFQSAIFASHASFENANFSQDAWFHSAAFSGTSFNTAIFSGDAWFNSAIFSHGAEFNSATFLRTAWFKSVIFSYFVKFDRATFTGEARFLSATFLGDVSFNSAIFAGDVLFVSANFCRESWFINTAMKGQTSFEGATLEIWPPRFFGATLHEGTIWHSVVWPRASRDRNVSRNFVYAYERLKLEMDRLKKHEDELNFFVLEMQSRRMQHGPWQGLPIALYGFLCCYGRSYLRPICGLFITVITGALALWPHFGWGKLDKAVGLSLANTFGVLGFRKDFVTPDVIKELSEPLVVIAGLQTVAGTVLLFLLGLALRNRFRMK